MGVIMSFFDLGKVAGSPGVCVEKDLFCLPQGFYEAFI